MTDPSPPDPAPPTRLHLRLRFADAMLGPGKAELLERINATGSISGAGRAMNMSYKRAWTLVEDMNAAFRAPLVASARGGAGGGGAHLTAEGAEVLRLYRAVVAAAAKAGARDIAALEAMLRPAPPSAAAPPRTSRKRDISGGK